MTISVGDVIAIITAVGAVIVNIIKANKATATADNAASLASDAHDAANDAKQTAVDNHEETKARLDDLETGRVPVKVTEGT